MATLDDLAKEVSSKLADLITHSMFKGKCVYCEKPTDIIKNEKINPMFCTVHEPTCEDCKKKMSLKGA